MKQIATLFCLVAFCTSCTKEHITITSQRKVDTTRQVTGPVLRRVPAPLPLIVHAGQATNDYAAPSSSQTHGTFTMTIPFTVTAASTTVYIPAATAPSLIGTVASPHATVGSFVQYAIDNGSMLLFKDATAQLAYTGTDNVKADVAGNFIIGARQTKSFALVITFQPSAAGSYRASLVSVNYNTTDAKVYSTYTEGLDNNLFKTAYVAGQ